MASLPILHDNSELILKSARGLLEHYLPPELHEGIDDILASPREKLQEVEAALSARIPDQFHFLLRKIEQLEPSKISLLEVTEAQAVNREIGLELAAEAELNFSKVVDEDSGDADPLVGIGVIGKYNFGASARVAKSLLSVGINGARGNSFQLQYFSPYRSDDYVLQTLLNAEQLWFDPSNLADVIDRLDNSSLTRFTRSGVATATLGLEVGIARAFESAYPELGIDLSAQAGVSLAVEFNDQSDFTLSVECSDSGYLIELEKRRNKASSSVLKLGVDVKLVGLRNRVLEKISAALPEGEEIQELLDKLDGYVERLGAQYLRPKLKAKLMELWPAAEPALAVVVGEKNVQELADTIRAELQEKLEDGLAGGVDIVNAQVMPTADSVAATVVLELGLPEGVSTDIQSYLREALAAALAEFQSHLEEGVDQVLPNEAVIRLLQPLAFIGGAVEQVFTQVEKNIQAPLKERLDAIKAIYQRYLRFRKGIIDAVKEKMEENFAISVVHKKERTQTQTQALRVQFKQLEASIEELYEQVWNGDLRELRTLTKALDPLPDVQVSGEYYRTMERLNDTQLNLNIFGLALSASTVFSDEVVVGFDHRGKLIAAQSEAALKKSSEFWGEQQLLSAEWNVDYLSDLELAPPVYITMQVRDKKFKRKEIKDFFGPLEEAGVMRKGAGEDAEKSLFSGHQQSIENPELKLKLPVPWRAWLNLVEQLDPAEAGERYMNVAKVTGSKYIKYVKEVMTENGYADSPEDMHTFLVAIGRLSSIKRAQRKYASYQSGRSAPVEIRESWKFGRVTYQLESHLATAQASWAAARLSVESGAAGDVIENRYWPV
jgi:hypothetical protein